MSDLMTGLDAISASLGAATPIATLPRPTQSTEMTEVKDAPEIEDDYQEARSNMKELISQAMEYVPEIMELAKQAQSDKMISAAANFLNTAANLNINLSKLSKEIKTVKQPKTVPGSSEQPAAAPQQITQNNVYVGSTEDFLNMMEERKKRRLEEEAAIDAEFSEVDKT